MSTPTRIRVMVVDDHHTLWQRLEVLIVSSSDLQLVGQATTREEALRLCAQFQPEVILMDLIIPDIGGPDTIRAVHERYPSINIIVFTTTTDEKTVRAAFQAGASGYLLKSMRIDKLPDAIRAAHAGHPVLAPEATSILIKAATKPVMRPRPLTPREREVLGLMMAGDNNGQISERLGIGRETVKTHVYNIIAKLGASNRVDAIVLASQRQLHGGASAAQ